VIKDERFGGSDELFMEGVATAAWLYSIPSNQCPSDKLDEWILMHSAIVEVYEGGDWNISSRSIDPVAALDNMERFEVEHKRIKNDLKCLKVLVKAKEHDMHLHY
jgi:hypothetical protein